MQSRWRTLSSRSTTRASSHSFPPRRLACFSWQVCDWLLHWIESAFGSTLRISVLFEFQLHYSKSNSNSFSHFHLHYLHSNINTCINVEHSLSSMEEKRFGKWKKYLEFKRECYMAYVCSLTMYEYPYRTILCIIISSNCFKFFCCLLQAFSFESQKKLAEDQSGMALAYIKECGKRVQQYFLTYFCVTKKCSRFQNKDPDRPVKITIWVPLSETTAHSITQLSGCASHSIGAFLLYRWTSQIMFCHLFLAWWSKQFVLVNFKVKRNSNFR